MYFPILYSEKDATAKFFKRISSIKVEYEKEKRRTLQNFQSSLQLDSEISFMLPKEEVLGLLRAELVDDDVILL
jgi:hypothetical protein